MAERVYTIEAAHNPGGGRFKSCPRYCERPWKQGLSLTCEVDQVVADVWQVVRTEREDARHGVKIERRRATN
jgi:hypothetical protein